MDITIPLSDDDLQSLPQPFKDALLIELQRRLQRKAKPETAVVLLAAAPNDEATGEVDTEEVQPADLSVAQATRFLEGCADKTKKVLRTIVGGGSREFRLSALAQSLSMATGDFAGVWTGVTKRTRTILGDKKSKLIAWPQNFYDAEDNWFDATGAVSETTYASLRKAFGI